MGRQKSKGAICFFCGTWYEPPQIRIKFRINGKDRDACDTHATSEKNKLEEWCKKEDKKAKAFVDPNKGTALVLLTDPSDYVDEATVARPTILTPQNSPEAFKHVPGVTIHKPRGA